MLLPVMSPSVQFLAPVTGTFQDFDVAALGTPYSLGIHAGPPTQAAQLLDGGPTGTGKMLRLAYATAPLPTHNSIAFDRTSPGAFDQIVADFDFRLSPGNGRADGFGFAFLRTANYGTTGAVAPQAPLFAAEEPNFTGSIGIGFDIYRSSPPLEVSNNHLSVHFNGALVQAFDVKPAMDLDLAVGEWIHARIILRPGGGYSDVTVVLTQCGRAPLPVVNQFRVTGFTPYEGRVHIAARSGGESANQDIDNVRVNFLSLEQSVLSFDNGCYTVVETDGSRQLTITRTGSSNEVATVNYATTAVSATAPSDYTAVAGTLTFGAGETTKTLSVPISNGSSTESEEAFQVSLSNPSVGAGLGGPAMAKVTIVDGTTARAAGHWSAVMRSDVIPIHMHLLPTGQVMYWDRHEEGFEWDGMPRLWDPATGSIRMSASPAYDVFCSGHSFLADGRLLVTGGHIEDGVGEDKASIYDPYSDSWISLPLMNKGRWYPSNVTLSDGDTLVVAGTYEENSVIQINSLPQLWQDAQREWKDLSTAPMGGYPAYADYYPFLYLAPNGKIFDAGPQQMARYLDTSGTGSWTNVASSSMPYRDYGSSVMYDDGKVLIVGGSNRVDYTPTASAEIINLNDAVPNWNSAIAPMHYARRQLNSTLLPDGKVLITGGSSAAGFDDSAGAVLPAEIWDPGTRTWTVMAAQTRYRGYHSTALLLPDGRVLVGGGGHPDPASGSEYNFEIFSPPYLFKGTRPVISAAPELLGYGERFFIQTPQAASISQVTLVRLSSVTHGFNQNQRFKRLTFTSAPGGLNATLPANANLLPPGHYMLFIINGDGVPSIARIIRINDIIVSIGGEKVGGYNLSRQGSRRETYTLDAGPVKMASTNAVPLIAALRDAFLVGGQVESFSQLMGLPREQLSDTYYFPAYNNITLSGQLRFANVDTIATIVTVTIGGVDQGTYPLQPNESQRVSYPLDTGPVVVTSSNGAKIIAALRDAFFVNGQVESFVQLMGLPKEQLSDTYYFPAYNNLTLNGQLRFANVDNIDTEVTVTIGGVDQGTYALQPNQSQRVSYPLDTGPVVITSSNGAKIIAALRDAYLVGGKVESFSQLMGLPQEQLSDSYVFPAYNNLTLSGQLRFANVDNIDTDVTITIGGQAQPIITLQPGESQRVSYPLDSGPVVVESSNGARIIVALRDAYLVNGRVVSFVQLMGLPQAALSDTSYFPAYNNLTLSGQLRFGVP
jgi:hypothetical protein